MLQRWNRKDFIHCLVTGEKIDSLKQSKEKNLRECSSMILCRWLGQLSTLRRSCCVSGGTWAVLFIMSCWNRTKTSLERNIKPVDVIKPSTAWKVATIQADARQNDSTAFTRSASRCQSSWKKISSAQMGSPTLCALVPIYCAVRLLLLFTFDNTWPGYSAVPLRRTSHMAWLVNSFKTWTLLP